VEVVEMQPLAVGAERHDHRVFAIGEGPVDVAAEHDAVVHRDRHVPIDAHAVTDLAYFAVVHRSPRRFYWRRDQAAPFHARQDRASGPATICQGALGCNGIQKEYHSPRHRPNWFRPEEIFMLMLRALTTAILAFPLVLGSAQAQTKITVGKSVGGSGFHI